MSKYIVDILDKDKYALEIDIMRNGSPASQRILDAVNVGTPYEERPHGEWIPFEWDDNYSTKIPLPKGSDSNMEEYWDEEFMCSVCGKAHHKRDFCPYCGADMRGEAE